MDRAFEILNYWFEGIDDSTPIDRRALPFRKWFARDARVDDEIRRGFEADLLVAADGRYRHWESTARGRLALIILFDQFARNIYRGTKGMYAYDDLALELALGALGSELERELPLIYRTFLYMPLMHAEDISLQRLSLECFTQLAEESKAKHPENTHYYEYTLKYAREHHDTVIQSGRFPQRDAILKRNES